MTGLKKDPVDSIGGPFGTPLFEYIWNQKLYNQQIWSFKKKTLWSDIRFMFAIIQFKHRPPKWLTSSCKSKQCDELFLAEGVHHIRIKALEYDYIIIKLYFYRHKIAARVCTGHDGYLHYTTVNPKLLSINCPAFHFKLWLIVFTLTFWISWHWPADYFKGHITSLITKTIICFETLYNPFMMALMDSQVMSPILSWGPNGRHPPSGGGLIWAAVKYAANSSAGVLQSHTTCQEVHSEQSIKYEILEISRKSKNLMHDIISVQYNK